MPARGRRNAILAGKSLASPVSGEVKTYSIRLRHFLFGTPRASSPTNFSCLPLRREVARSDGGRELLFNPWFTTPHFFTFTRREQAPALHYLREGVLQSTGFASRDPSLRIDYERKAIVGAGFHARPKYIMHFEMTEELNAVKKYTQLQKNIAL